ncbi:2-dehydro-3-deoxygalactonokinase [Megasphaera hexanoica]|uniref:2-dehydro-3-deoxygalactonokinase n=2 Tax=Megasphaera hexanoica TaxID=1675036 RepID=A0ABW7DKU2_9FIRM|nr:2-dehydro-3-deoxygalactonokinase [Megasphaera hexanoica]
MQVVVWCRKGDDMYIATIDGGTSNTRVFVWHDGIIAGQAKAAVGVRNTAMDGTNQRLQEAVRDTLAEAARMAGVATGDISIVLAAGMLTSNVGLCDIPHVTAPVSLEGLAQAMVVKELPAICQQPLWFVPGVRNCDPATLTPDQSIDMDMMRGEEVEAAGLLAQAAPEGKAVFVLPGSHNKYVMIDEQQRIQGCLTTLYGELLHSLTFDTILADTLNRSFASEFLAGPFRKGVSDYYQMGLLHGAFMTRILGMFCHYTAQEAQNYLLGLLMADDMTALKRSRIFAGLEKAIFVVAGNTVMQKAYEAILKKDGYQVVLAAEEQQQALSGRGALYLAGLRGLL